jgi:hypothetical protein
VRVGQHYLLLLGVSRSRHATDLALAAMAKSVVNIEAEADL